MEYECLEIGCGEHQRQEEGWAHLDIRALPGIDFVQDARDLSNIQDNTFSTIETKDLIEHLSWRDVPAAIKEWVRVLKPGGTLLIETPSVLEILVMLHNPKDESLHRYNNESDFEMFNRVLFGHQDYPENSHKSYFSEDWLKSIMYEAGCSKVDVLRSDTFRIQLGGKK